MSKQNLRAHYWLLTASLGALMSATAIPASAQDQSASDDENQPAEATQDQAVLTTQTLNSADSPAIVVTGSRIRGSSDTKAAAPVAQLDAEIIGQKGYVQAGELLRELPSNATIQTTPPSAQGTQGSGGSSVPINAPIGQDFPDLFSLGPSRTLSLLNGRRLPSTSNGLELEATDANIIPTGLLERVDVVQGGGASVYGSGAIAGVVNYVLNQNFSGLELEGQYRGATRGGVRGPLLRAVAGLNFDNGRGNVAVQLDYAKTSALQWSDRWDIYPRGAPAGGNPIINPAPGAGTNGVPSTIYVPEFVHPLVAQNGVVLFAPFTLLPDQAPQIDGGNITIDDNGNIVPSYMGEPTLSFGSLRGGGDP